MNNKYEISNVSTYLYYLNADEKYGSITFNCNDLLLVISFTTMYKDNKLQLNIGWPWTMNEYVEKFINNMTDEDNKIFFNELRKKVLEPEVSKLLVTSMNSTILQ